MSFFASLYLGAGVHNLLSRWAILGSPVEDTMEALIEIFLWPRYLYTEFKR